MNAEWARGWLKIRVDKTLDHVFVETFLADILKLPASFIRRMTANSSIRINGKNASLESMLQTGQMLYLSDPSDLAAQQVSTRLISVEPPPILYEDAHLLIVAKKFGIIVHSTDANELTLDRQVEAYYQLQGYACRVLHVHRLDKWTTGAVVYAKHGLAARALDRQISNKVMERVYLAVTVGRSWPTTSEVAAEIGRDRHRSGLYRVSSMGKTARTYVNKVAESSSKDGVLSLIKCRLETGRTHQIRVHAAHVGAPILGDTEYGGVASIHGWPDERAIALHAAAVSFLHPYDGDKLVVTSPVDEGWRAFLRQEWRTDVVTLFEETLVDGLSPHAES